MGERLGVVCQSPLAHHNRRPLLGLLRERARLALRLPSAAAPWPFGKELRVMLGGRAGLKRVLAFDEGDPARAANIHALVRRAQEAFGTLEALPFREIGEAIAACVPRPRHGSRE